MDPKEGDLNVLQAVQTLSGDQLLREATAESISDLIGIPLEQVKRSLRTLQNEYLVQHQTLAGLTETGLYGLPGFQLTRKGEDLLA